MLEQEVQSPGLLSAKRNVLTTRRMELCMENGMTMADCFKIEKLDSITDALKEELIEVWEKSVRSSHHFLSEEDLMYYRSRIMDTYFHSVELYVVRHPHIVAFMGLSDEMVEMLFVLPSEKGKGYGSSLLDFALTKKHIRKIDVNEQNTEAYQFYLRKGYKVTGKDYTDADGKPYPIMSPLEKVPRLKFNIHSFFDIL